jgi:hypothetical protein
MIMSLVTPNTLTNLELPEEFSKHLEDAQGTAERFFTGFTPLTDRKLRQAVMQQLEEEFPNLVNQPQIVEKICEKLGPEAFEEKPFIFLSKNPAFIDATSDN